MRKTTLLFIFLISIFSCSVTEKPEFLNLERVELKHADKHSVTIFAKALFKNPNHVGGQLQANNITITVNDVKVATLQTEPFTVPAKDEFSMPLEITIPTKKVINTNSLSGILNSLITQELTIQYLGDIQYSAIGITYNYPLNYTQNITIKL